MYLTMLILVAITATCWELAVASAVVTTAATLAASVEASTAIEPAEDDDEVVATSFWHRDIHSSSTLSEYGIPQCNSTGKFADPDDCGKYYECVPDHNGGFVARQKSCFGHAFHPTLQTCAPLRMVEGCIPHSIRMVPDEDTYIKELCDNADNEFFCLDCKTLIMCVENVPYIKPCGSGRVCDNNTSSFEGGVCYPGEPVNCTCDKDYIFRQDIYNESKFLTCDVAGSDPTIYKCPEGLVFNEECAACAEKNEETCAAKGPYKINKDCTGYFTYLDTFQGWVQIEFTCKSKTMFNEKTGKCENPCEWYIDDFTCKEEGRFANKGDCRKYHECVFHPSKNELVKVEQQCPEGFEWGRIEDEDIDHCVINSTSTEECSSQLMPDNCVIPDWCTAAVCSPNCTNGECIGPNICNCNTGWTGNLCENFDCGFLGSQYLTFGTQCLTIINEDIPSWIDAVEACANNGGILASLATTYQEVQAYLAANYDAGKGFWVGGSDFEKEGSWVWMNGEQMEQIDGLETNNPVENCMVLYSDSVHDYPCYDHHFRYICEFVV